MSDLQPPALTGVQGADTVLAAKALMAGNPETFPTVQSVKDWLLAENLALHYATDTSVQVVPAALSRLVPDVGGASGAEFQRRSP